MKRMYLIIAMCVMCACMLSACNLKQASFNGSKTGDENHFDISFDVLNTTYTHTFELEHGEKLLVHVEKKSGDIKLMIQDEQQNIVYEGNGDVTTDFSVGIPQDGTYTVSVTGKKAKGHVTFTRE